MGRTDQLIAALRAETDPERAVYEKRYQKSRWEHWGIGQPGIDAVLKTGLDKATAEERLAVATDLWPSPVWDLRIASTRILAGNGVPADSRLWRWIAERMPDLDGWAIADTLAKAAQRCLLADPAHLDTVESWVENPHLWTRRASLVFTLPWTKPERSPERMLSWAIRLSPEREWFIQKAIGWWLRALSKHDPDRVRRFLAENGEPLMATARREATKYLGPADRA